MNRLRGRSAAHGSKDGFLYQNPLLFRYTACRRSSLHSHGVPSALRIPLMVVSLPLSIPVLHQLSGAYRPDDSPCNGSKDITLVRFFAHDPPASAPITVVARSLLTCEHGGDNDRDRGREL